ncbi:MAG TPA: ATP-binding protein [Rhodopila sp.]|nr:ATP-binding protein [Rhodopila sp.]
MTKPQQGRTSPDLSLTASGGGMVRRVQAYDWSKTPLGAPEAWPQSLRTAASLVLRARQPMFLAWGPDLTLLYNDAYAGVLGSKHPRALGQAFKTAWADIWPQFGPLVEQVMAGDALSFDDLPIPMRRNGYLEDTWFSFSYTPLYDEDDRIAGLFCACVETTGKVRAEKQLRVTAEALAQLNAELEQRVEERTRDRDRIWRLSTDLMLVADFHAQIHAVNPAWTHLLGWSRDELIGRDFLSLVHPDDQEATRRETGRLADGIITIRFENRYRQKDGTYRWLSWTAVPDEQFIHAVGRDVQAEKEAAEVLRNTEEQLRQAQKMEAIGQLTGGIAHDFNNLLTGISGSLELLRDRVAQGRTGDLARYIDAALRGADRAAVLTHRLLAFSRQQTLEARPVLANPLIAETEELIARTVGPSIRVETRLAPDLWLTLCDPHQLENALLNLCINARDAMPQGGRLTIKTANGVLEDLDAREQDLPPGQYVMITVRDTGTGMTAAVRAKAFDPFFTTKPVGMGTGLGLSMVYGFVRQSGGQVQINSAPGQGTEVTLYLPRNSGSPEASCSHPAPAEAVRPVDGRIVLVVEDEPTVRMLVTEVLENLGCGVLVASDGQAGLAILRSDAKVDLLISDVGLPGNMNGRQMVDAARLVRPGLRILFITGYAEQAVLDTGRLEPGMHIMTKPFALDVLADRIKNIL